MNTVCTIVTADYFPLAQALHASLEKQVPGTLLHVLVTDREVETTSKGLITHSLAELQDSLYFHEIEKKYAHANPHSFRWALKPIFIGHLLHLGFDKVLFADADIFFIGNFEFLFSELSHHTVLLTPHWANMDPTENDDSLLSVLKGGMFNAGFIGAGKNGAAAMAWWAGLCHYKTEESKELGLFFDQKYLDILPVQFEDAGIIRHRGCNLASWNIDTSKREMVNGKLLINGIYDPVFIHFAKDTVVNILNRNDALLRPWLDEYVKLLQDYGFDLLKNLDNYDPIKYNSGAYKLKHQLRIRTRLKRFFFKLAEKL